MKIVLIGDVHIDNGNGSKIHQNVFNNFCSKVLFPTLKERNIYVVLQTGDLFHSRKSVSTDGLDNAKKNLFNVLEENDIEFHTILGNHDILLRHSLEINTPELVLSEYENIKIYKKPTTVNFGGISVDIIPWICDENEVEVLDFIIKSKSDYCFAHLELSGFKMSKSHVAEHGMDFNLFKRYKEVWSGHYHTQSKKGNIHYLGNPTQDTWEAVDEVKGIHIFDTETLEMEFVPNPYNLYERVEYDEDKEPVLVDAKDKYIKVIVKKQTDDKKYDSYLDYISKQEPLDIKVVDNTIISETIHSDITIEQVESNSFDAVVFLTEHTMNNNSDLTDYQKNLTAETYKLLFEQSWNVD